MIRKTACSLLAAFVALFPAGRPAFSAGYTYGSGQSGVFFTLKHLGVVTVAGRFREFSGTFRFDPARIEESEVRLSIRAASLDTGNPVRDAHLRSPEFFWTEKYPEITFVSREFGDVRGNRFSVKGDLTIRGITMPVVFDTEMKSGEKEAAEGKPVRFYTQTFIRRKDFRLGTGNWLDPIAYITDETLKISLEVTGVPETGS